MLPEPSLSSWDWLQEPWRKKGRNIIGYVRSIRWTGHLHSTARRGTSLYRNMPVGQQPRRRSPLRLCIETHLRSHPSPLSSRGNYTLTPTERSWANYHQLPPTLSCFWPTRIYPPVPPKNGNSVRHTAITRRSFYNPQIDFKAAVSSFLCPREG